MGEFEDLISDAIDTLRVATGKGPYALFYDGLVDEPGVLASAEGQRAAGFIEGAAVALGLTPSELLDQLDYPDSGSDG
jgi:hypothetical protein